jgi:hypothetical protein
MTLQVVASPMINILMTSEAPMIVIMTTLVVSFVLLENIYIQASLIIIPYEHHLRSSLMIITYDHHLQLPLAIITYDHHL